MKPRSSLTALALLTALTSLAIPGPRHAAGETSRHPEGEPRELEGSGRADLSSTQILQVAEAPLRMTSRSRRSQLRSLPLVEVPALLPGAQRDEMAVLLTGDGGWAATDRGLSRALARGGIPVVGWNSLRYFLLKRKSPGRATRDLERILRHYLGRWHKDKVILIGYSFGADVMPFLAARLPHDLAERISLLVLLGPSGRADFRFHPIELLGRDSKDSLPTLPELERLRGTPILCVQGAQEKHSYCPKLPEGLATVLVRPGGHIIDKNYGPIATWILGPRKASN